MGTYSNPPTNYVGMVLFISYIIAALVLTFHLIILLHNLSQIRPKVRTRALVLKAFFTFSIMSVDMLSILFDSYKRWAKKTGIQPAELPTLEYLWRWMLESNLFADFADDIPRSRSTLFWSEAALLWTIGVSIWMSGEGRRVGASMGMMLEIFMVGQILPVSFAMELTMIASLLLLSKGTNTEETARHTTNPMLTGAFFVVVVTYLSSLALLSASEPSSNVSLTTWGILVLRLSLFAPCLAAYSIPSSSEAMYQSSKPALRLIGAGGAALLAWQLASAVQHEGWHTVTTAWNANAAVRTLVVDTTLGLLGSLLWTSMY
jgi:hypothetical protein